MISYQQVLIVSTKTESLRDLIVGWSLEDGSVDADKVEQEQHIEVSMLRSNRHSTIFPKTIAHALRQHWKLLTFKVISKSEVEWIMTREVDLNGINI